jgi:hypothetical protein
MAFKKKKGHAYCVEWDSDDSSDSDSDDDGYKKSTKNKSLESIPINEKVSIFDTPSWCFMAVPPNDNES